MGSKSEEGLLEEACKLKFLSRWPDSHFNETNIQPTDFFVELADRSLIILDKKSQKSDVKNTSLNWSPDRIGPVLYQAILRAIKLDRPILHSTYRASRIYAGKTNKKLTGFKVSLARTTTTLTWDDIFPDDPRPASAQWTVAAQSVKTRGKYLVIVHTLKDGKLKQINEYKIEIKSISKAIYDSTLLFNTFPFNIPHTHKITENGSVTYDRSIDEWAQHADQKGLLEDSKVRRKDCSNCAAHFYDTSAQTLCYACMVTEQGATRKKAVSLCKQAEKLSRKTDWKETADAIKQLQLDWQKLKSLSKDDSDKLWERFQTATQLFFDARGSCFDKQDKFRTANKKKAERLIEEVRRWSGSNDWKHAGDEIKSLQKQWKSVNPLPREHSECLWNNFRHESQKFFDRRAAYFDNRSQR